MMIPNATDRVVATLRVLADPARWRLLTVLRNGDQQVGELVSALGLPQNLVSYHLGLLREAGLVRLHRSEADARTVYYGADLAALSAAYAAIGAALALNGVAGALPVEQLVVFLCTGNSARSQMAEGWLRQLSGGRIPVRSAGTHPRALHPLAVQAMAEAGVDIGYQHAKDLSALHGQQPGVLITVCDRAREECAPQIQAAVQLHWSIPDPALAVPQDLTIFRAVRDDLRVRVAGLLSALPDLVRNTP
jgi:ArsR family transcriptional regulator, arsenate/arsenite/antimonite-responsive transcriptional repressor / arsenate reductase (thioredoxin)